MQLTRLESFFFNRSKNVLSQSLRNVNWKGVSYLEFRCSVFIQPDQFIFSVCKHTLVKKPVNQSYSEGRGGTIYLNLKYGLRLLVLDHRCNHWCRQIKITFNIHFRSAINNSPTVNFQYLVVDFYRNFKDLRLLL